jgi:hypothetical protein
MPRGEVGTQERRSYDEHHRANRTQAERKIFDSFAHISLQFDGWKEALYGPRLFALSNSQAPEKS